MSSLMDLITTNKFKFVVFYFGKINCFGRKEQRNKREIMYEINQKNILTI
jgi:hypothetical protein